MGVATNHRNDVEGFLDGLFKKNILRKHEKGKVREKIEMEDAAIREKELQAKLEESVSRKGGARCLVLNAQPSTFLV